MKRFLIGMMTIVFIVSMSIPVFASSDQKVDIVKVTEEGAVFEGGVATDVFMAPAIFGSKVMKASTWSQGNVTHEYPNGYGFYVICMVAKKTWTIFAACINWLVHPSIILSVLILAVYLDWRKRFQLYMAEQHSA